MFFLFKKKIQLSKFEDLIDFIQQSMNQTGSQQVKRRLWQELYKIEGYYRKGAEQESY